MSSFICSPKHFNSVEWNLRNLLIYNTRDFYFPYELKAKYPILYNRSGSVEMQENELQAVMDNLRELNAVCVTLQYKDHYIGSLDKEIQTQKDNLLNNRKAIKPAVLNTRGLYNALKCINYQIEIEHLKDLFGLNDAQRDAMSFLKEMINALAHHIVSQLPEEKGNNWSID